jgi:hypothetical protein
MLEITVQCSFTGASDFRIGESWSSVAPGGVQRVSSQPMGMKT